MLEDAQIRPAKDILLSNRNPGQPQSGGDGMGSLKRKVMSGIPSRKYVGSHYRIDESLQLVLPSMISACR